MANQADEAIAFALSQVGKPYVFGASGPNSYDCSGLVMAAYAHAGIVLPHSTYLMVNMGTPVDAAHLMPGDLVFPEAGHVQMWLGGGKIVEAPTTGIPVRVVPQWGGVWRARRVASQPGTGGSIPTPSANGVITTAAATITPAGFSLTDVGSALSGIGKALGFIADPANWLRVAEFLAGIALVLFAIYELSKEAA